MLCILGATEHRTRSGEVMLDCLCKCGNRKLIAKSRLTHRSSKVRSCGCIRRRAAAERSSRRLIDLSGRKFGHLLVMFRDGTASNGQPTWTCWCDCGQVLVKAMGSNLKNGTTRSCGCLRREVASKRLKTAPRNRSGQLTSPKKNARRDRP